MELPCEDSTFGVLQYVQSPGLSQLLNHYVSVFTVLLVVKEKMQHSCVVALELMEVHFTESIVGLM